VIDGLPDFTLQGLQFLLREAEDQLRVDFGLLGGEGLHRRLELGHFVDQIQRTAVVVVVLFLPEVLVAI
jgi:hypothetical protein